MSNRTKQNIYIAIITAIAFYLLYNFYVLDNEITFSRILMWSILVIITETFQIISPSAEGSTSVSPAIYIYVALMSNPLNAIICAMVGVLLRFPEMDGVRKHIFNVKRSTTFFNLANMMITFGVCAYFIYSFNSYDNLVITGVVVIFGLLIAELINLILVTILIKITQKVKTIDIAKSMAVTFPSTVAIGSLGIFLAIIDDVHYGIVFIFILPLLLARYSFKLYFESQRMALDTIHALNEALHAKDAYTGGHTGRVEKYAIELAKAYGLSRQDIEIIKTAALLHDIGKIGIPDEILNKPGRLTRDEFEMIQEHSSIGAKILGNVNSLKKVSNIIVQHHERYDGTGYPGRLKGDQISIEASILMISDSYDAMTTDRPYRKALSKEKAISELEKYSGVQFHPLLTRTFIDGVLARDDEELESLSDSVTDDNILERTKEVVEEGSDLHKGVLEQQIVEKEIPEKSKPKPKRDTGHYAYKGEV